MSVFVPMLTYTTSVFVKSFFAGIGKYISSVFFKTVSAFSAISLRMRLTSLFKSLVILVVLMGFKLASPYSYFAISTFLQCISISARLILPEVMASFNLAIAKGTSPGRQSISLPAIMDSTEAVPSGKNFFTPCISRASVKVNPWYPISFLNKSVTLFFDNEVALLALVSIEGMYKCAIITLPTPALKISRNGYNSKPSN